MIFLTVMMASSQRDMFFSSPEKSPGKSPERQSSSLPATLAYTYLWVVLFDWDENVERPFNLYQVAIFSRSEMKPKWIKGELNCISRKKKLKFSALPGKNLSLFAKVEKGFFKLFFVINLNYRKIYPYFFL